jgi:hypothetical protein
MAGKARETAGHTEWPGYYWGPRPMRNEVLLKGILSRLGDVGNNRRVDTIL